CLVSRSSFQLCFRGWSFSLFPLSSFELGGPFVDECLHSFFHVLGGEEEVEVSSLELESLVESCFERFEDGVFCESSSYGSFVGDLSSEFLSFLIVGFDGNHSIYESIFFSFSSCYMLTSQNHFHYSILTKRSCPSLGSAGARHYADINLWLAELGSLRCV